MPADGGGPGPDASSWRPFAQADALLAEAARIQAIVRRLSPGEHDRHNLAHWVASVHTFHPFVRHPRCRGGIAWLLTGVALLTPIALCV